MKHKWLLMDGRARVNPDRATVLEVCSSLQEAQTSVPDHRGPACDFDPVIFKVEVHGNKFLNLQMCRESEQVPR